MGLLSKRKLGAINNESKNEGLTAIMKVWCPKRRVNDKNEGLVVKRKGYWHERRSGSLQKGWKHKNSFKRYFERFELVAKRRLHTPLGYFELNMSSYK